MSTTLRPRTLKPTSTWDRDTPETKTKPMFQRRIAAEWTAFAKHRDIFKGNIRTCLKRQVYNSYVVPAMTYGAVTWTLTTKTQNKLAAVQTKMERSVLNITYRDRKTNICLREKTKVTDVIEQVRRQKWTWAGHVSRIRDNRWTLGMETLRKEKT